jgi:hypothetical protein
MLDPGFWMLDVGYQYPESRNDRRKRGLFMHNLKDPWAYGTIDLKHYMKGEHLWA